MLKRVFIIVIVAVAMIGIMIPSAFAGNTVINTVDESSWLQTCAVSQGGSGCYTPVTATVFVGDIVTMTNTDPTGVHTFTSGTVDGFSTLPDGTFDSGVLMSGDSFEWIPTQAGEQPYYCMLHTWAIGTIIVEELPSGGGRKNNCDSNEFKNNNSLRVYQVMYDIDTYQVQVQAYSTCGSISAKMTTPTQQSILGLSMDQTLLDDRIVIYSGYLNESDKKFNISIQNKRDSFDETFYINDKSIVKKYTGNTGYTSQQQDRISSVISSAQISISSEPSVTVVSQTIEESLTVGKKIVAEKSVIDQIQSIQYTPEPIVKEILESICGIGTESVNGICKIIILDEPQSCFLFWCW